MSGHSHIYGHFDRNEILKAEIKRSKQKRISFHFARSENLSKQLFSWRNEISFRVSCKQPLSV